MSRAIQDATACREALLRLPKLGLGELRQQWRVLYKAEASPHLSRELLLRAVAYRMQEVALGGLRPERQRQLRQFARQLNGSGEGRIRPRPELKPGTRLVREWQGRTYEVLVLDDGFSWQGTQLPLAFRPREKDHRHSVVGTALLRIEAEPARRSQALAGTRSQPERTAMPRADASRRRCAIYTRKSSEEGLEQEFNSLAAQREACEAYIRSQQHEGWVLVEKPL